MEERAGLTISFPWGLPGLEDQEYHLYPLAKDAPFFFLCSVRQPEIGLVLVNPFALDRDYNFELPEETAKQLKISGPGQAAVFCTVNASRGLAAATVNLLAPIIINTGHRLGRQVVLNEKKYSLRAPLVFKTGAAKEAD